MKDLYGRGLKETSNSDDYRELDWVLFEIGRHIELSIVDVDSVIINIKHFHLLISLTASPILNNR